MNNIFISYRRADSAESMTTEAVGNCDVQLERGFDPCLINASLPACNPDPKSSYSGAAFTLELPDRIAVLESHS